MLTLSQLMLIGAVAAAGAAGLTLVLAVLPAKARAVVLTGYRANSRADGLAQNGTLKLMWPLVELGAQYAASLPVPNWRAKAQKLLNEAGVPLGLDVDELFGMIFASTSIGFACTFVINLVRPMGAGLYMVAGFVGVCMPFMWLSEIGKLRFKQINRGLPQALDLIVMAMGAGLDFTGSMRHVVERWSDKKDHMYIELHRLLHELSLGKTRKEALEDLAVRAPTELVRTFVANVIQAEQRGTPLVEILAVQAEVARTRRFQTAEKIAGRAGVLILLPLMLIFAATLLVLFGGLIVKNYRGTLTS
jgi:tight adherence protein C